MDVVSLCAFRASGFEWQPRAGTYVLTVICKATFELRPNECVLAPEQKEPSNADAYWNDNPGRSMVVPSDRVPYKPRADVVLVGHAYAPKQQLARSIMARLLVGEIDKSIEVWCDRGVRTHARQLLEGQRQAKMLLTWERAAGGPETSNPVGMRFDAAPDQYGMVAIPNLQPPGMHYGTWGDTFEPIGYGPIAPHWPSRVQKLHRYASSFVMKGWEDRPLPDHFDYGYFSVAPPDQQLAELRANERIVLENMHPKYERLVTNLPGIRPRAIADRTTGEREEITLAADTLWIDTDRGICSVVWRGRIGLRHRQEAGRVAFWVDGLPTASVTNSALKHIPFIPTFPENQGMSLEDMGTITLNLEQNADTGPSLPFTKGAPLPPSLAGSSGAAPSPWLGSIAKTKARDDGTETLIPAMVEAAKDPLPFVHRMEATPQEAHKPAGALAPPRAANASAFPPASPLSDASWKRATPRREEDWAENVLPLRPPVVTSTSDSAKAPTAPLSPVVAADPPPPAPPLPAPPPIVGLIRGSDPSRGFPQPTPTFRASLPSSVAPIPPAPAPMRDAPEEDEIDDDDKKPSRASVASPAPTAFVGGVTSKESAEESSPSSPGRDRVLAALAEKTSLVGADLVSADLSDLDLRENSLEGATLTGAKLLRCKLVRSKLSKANLRGADLSGADLSGADLSGADLSGALLSDANLTRAVLTQAKLDDAIAVRTIFQGARLEKATCSNAQFAECVLDAIVAPSSVWDGAALVRASIQGADLTKASLVATKLDGAKLSGSTLKGATLREAALSKAILLEVDLGGAKLARATGEGAVFDHASLDGADLRLAKLSGASFTAASLRNVKGDNIDATRGRFERADLRKAAFCDGIFQGADLTNAQLNDTDFRDADLTGATVREADLAGAKIEGAALSPAEAARALP